MELTPLLSGKGIATVLVVLFAFGAVHLIRKHGGLKNALWGGRIQEIGSTQIVGTEPNRDSAFRVSLIQREGKCSMVLVEISDSDSGSWSKRSFTLSANEAEAVGKLFGEAAKRA
jgi:hypothetical protein